MKIAVLKKECSHGDKTTVIGTVKWVGDVKTHQGDKGDFKTQSLLVTDGEQTDDKRNSIFCGFYADKNSWEYLKGKEVTLHGTCNVYQGKMEMRGCNLKDYPQQGSNQSQQAPQQARQATNAPSGNKDRLIVTQVVFKAMSAAGGVNEQLLSDNVDMIMRVGSGQTQKQIPLDQFIDENPVEQDDQWEH